MTLALTIKVVRDRRGFCLGSILIKNHLPFPLVLRRHFESCFAFHLFNPPPTFLDYEDRKTLLHIPISDPQHLLDLLQALVHSQHMVIHDEIRLAGRERVQDNIRSKFFTQQIVKLL
jgi:hypothetical protein